MSRATVVLADDHGVVREGIRMLLERQPDLSVIGETSDGLQVIELVERLRPDLLVLDLMMPGLGALDIARQIRRRSASTKVMILSLSLED